ncbi:unnamed protein product [Boreogadus saida]
MADFWAEEREEVEAPLPPVDKDAHLSLGGVGVSLYTKVQEEEGVSLYTKVQEEEGVSLYTKVQEEEGVSLYTRVQEEERFSLLLSCNFLWNYHTGIATFSSQFSVSPSSCTRPLRPCGAPKVVLVRGWRRSWGWFSLFGGFSQRSRVLLKVERSLLPWDFYVLSQLRRRLSPEDSAALPSARCFLFQDACVTLYTVPNDQKLSEFLSTPSPLSTLVVPLRVSSGGVTSGGVSPCSDSLVSVDLLSSLDLELQTDLTSAAQLPRLHPAGAPEAHRLPVPGWAGCRAGCRRGGRRSICC